ncbi:uncharacterized protein LOC135161513 [Diachasmimorpha longicaudata]|uniref:uncharacterized protein LOC135161513 n=1 Tax=Diachasmimorpha longicaudata TaxID=58733 RepID=UPI0030B9144D
MSLDKISQTDLAWWTKNIPNAINSIKCFNPTMEMFTDASTSGWGAYCNGIRTNGFWRKDERIKHINELELIAVIMGLKSLVGYSRRSDIVLRVDNTTAIAYINKKGGIKFPALNKVAKEIWDFCEQRELWVMAAYIKSEKNHEADFESRKLEPETEFALSDEAVREITRKFGQPDVDLFASRSNAKCHQYVSWKKDPDSIAIDAFTISWKKYFFYAFPPFSVILRILQKIQSDEAEGIMASPALVSYVPSPLVEKPYPGGSYLIREGFKRKGVPEESLEIILSSLSDSSKKQYNCGLKKWWLFCSKQNHDTFEYFPETVLRFLTREFNESATYGTLNCYRSAVGLLYGPELGENATIKRFVKGIAKKRPSRPKNDTTWDPQIVLDYLSGWEKMTKKLTVLLMLVTGQRMQTLALIMDSR